MGFDRALLPEPIGYFESENLCLSGRGKWRTARCVFHGGSDSMRINVESGGWCCMSCGARGGDVLAYAMQAHDLEFIDACKALDCWIGDGQPAPRRDPAPLSPRQALSVLAFESMLIAVEGSRIARGEQPDETDMQRLRAAANRVSMLAEAYK